MFVVGLGFLASIFSGFFWLILGLPFVSLDGAFVWEFWGRKDWMGWMGRAFFFSGGGACQTALCVLEYLRFGGFLTCFFFFYLC